MRATAQVSVVNGAGQFLRWGPAPLKRLGWRFLAQVSRAKSGLFHPCYRPAPFIPLTCPVGLTDLHHRLPVSVPNAARGRAAPSLSCRKRAGTGRLTVQLVLLRALRPVTSSNNVRHARLRSVRPDDWRHRPSVSHPGTAPCTIPTRMPVSANSLRRSPFPSHRL